ncbi:MAG TPA: response regulator transcription factor [Rhizomicrobium sp.]|nr:response regulator transcription factor [Rhizomicrobium sp.]
MRVLVVEDEAKLLNILLRSLKGEGLVVDGVGTAEAASEYIKSFHYDLVILDLQLPDSPGTALLRRLRSERHAMPVLILTARSDIDSKAEGFSAGADDYLTKPFSLAELSMRVHALLRRAPAIQDSVLKFANLEINRLTRQVRRAGKRIELSPKEYSLLEYLSLHAGRALSRSMIVERVWDQSFEGLTNIVDVYIGHLRRKIDEGYEPKLIRTVRGLGYSLDAGEAE